MVPGGELNSLRRPFQGREVRELHNVGKSVAIGVDGEWWLVLH
jgi:hypothetical protein